MWVIFFVEPLVDFLLIRLHENKSWVLIKSTSLLTVKYFFCSCVNIRTHIPIPLLGRVHTHIHLGVRLSYSLPGAPLLHTHTSSCLLESLVKMTDMHTHTQIQAWVFAQTRIHCSVTIDGENNRQRKRRPYTKI